MSKLDEAFTEAEKIHTWLDETGSEDFNYLLLECIGGGGVDNARWAATFDTVLDNYEWYEPHCIADYPTAARADSPEDAILAAVVKVKVRAGVLEQERR